MALFNWFGESEHRVFNYKPRYYDPEKEERERKRALRNAVENRKEKGVKIEDGKNEATKTEYTPGSLVRGAFRDGHYSKEKSHATKAQNIIGLIGLLLVILVLYYMAKFYILL